VVSLEFFLDIILPAALWLWVDSASTKNEYQEYFLGSKGGRCVGLTALSSSRADFLEIWEHHRPESLQGLSRPEQGLVYLPSYAKLTAEFAR